MATLFGQRTRSDPTLLLGKQSNRQLFKDPKASLATQKAQLYPAKLNGLHEKDENTVSDMLSTF